jgi:alpha-beta hydrolase superfamily lysophospholipase
MMVTGGGPMAWDSALIAAGALAGLGGLGLFLRQRWIVFKPSRTLLADPCGLGLAFEDVFAQLDGGVRIHGWWIPREDSRKLILCLPGSIGNISHELNTLAFLRDLGASVFIIDYPGFGKSEGRPSERGCYAAAEAAWNFATRDKGVRPEDVIVFGRSLGGTVAARLAARHPDCGRLVMHSAFTSVPDVAGRAYPFFPVRYFCYIRFNTLKQIRACRCPTVVLHPIGDTVIPLRHGQRIFEQAAAPKRFIPLRGNHYGSEWQNTPGLQRELWELTMGEARTWA